MKHVVCLKLIDPMKLQVNKLRSLTLVTKVRVLNSFVEGAGYFYPTREIKYPHTMMNLTLIRLRFVLYHINVYV